MSIFKYSAIDNLKFRRHGIIFADNKQIAKQQLFRRGLNNIKLKREFAFNHKINNAEFTQFWQEFNSLIKAKIRLKNALEIIKNNTHNYSLNLWITKILNALECGFSFYQALQQHNNDKIFKNKLTNAELSLLQIGEITAKLDIVVENLSHHRQASIDRKQRVQKIMIYPLILLFITLSLTLILLIFVVPQFQTIYSDSSKLPQFSQLIFSLSSSIIKSWHYYLILAIIGFVAFKYISQKLLKSSAVKYKIPILGTIKRLELLIDFCSSLALMLSQGINLDVALKTMETTENTAKNKRNKPLKHDFLTSELKRAQNLIAQGYPLANCFSSDFLPNKIQAQLIIAEQSGSLAGMLNSIALTNQKNLNHRIDMLSNMLEPLLMLIIGVVVGSILIGLYMPIFNLGDVLG